MSHLKTPTSPQANANSSRAWEAWQAWQEKLDESSLTPAHTEQATKVLVRLMTIRQHKAQARGQ